MTFGIKEPSFSQFVLKHNTKKLSTTTCANIALDAVLLIPLTADPVEPKCARDANATGMMELQSSLVTLLPVESVVEITKQQDDDDIIGVVIMNVFFPLMQYD